MSPAEPNGSGEPGKARGAGEPGKPRGAGEPGKARGAGVRLRFVAAVVRFAFALGVLVAFLGMGAAVADGAGLPVPGSVLGMVLLTAALELRLVPLAWVRPAADPLLRHMGLLFVPPGVAVMVHAELIAAEWLPILAGSAASAVAVLVVVGRAQQWIVIATGVIGAVVGPAILRATGVRSPTAFGLALGASAHGAGTARAIEEGEIQGATSGLAIGLMGVGTAVLAPVILGLLAWIGVLP